MVRAVIERVMQHPAIRERPYVAEFVKFAIVGVTNTVIDFSIYFFLTRFVTFFQRADHFLIANVIAFSIAVTNSYAWNRRWTFRNSPGSIARQFPIFLAVNLIGLSLNEGSLYLLVRSFHLYDLFGKVIAICLSTTSNFLLSRFWAFKPPRRVASRE